eukprot:3942876-Amphidinium_carterae.1
MHRLPARYKRHAKPLQGSAASATTKGLRPGSAASYLELARRTTVPDRSSTAGHTYSRVVISEATPTSSAVTVTLPEVLPASNVGKGYDPAQLLRSLVGHGRLSNMLTAMTSRLP